MIKIIFLRIELKIKRVIKYIKCYICHGKGIKRDNEVWSFCNNRGFQHGHWQMCRQTMVVPMCMCNGFPAKKMEQTIMTSLCDIMRISHAENGREL